MVEKAARRRSAGRRERVKFFRVLAALNIAK